MGLFDFLSKKNDDKGQPKPKSSRELMRLGRLASNKMSQNFDRQEAINELSRIGTAEAAALLLKRFNWSMDPTITDQDEKEQAARGVVAAGEAALDAIREYCARAESLTWPLKVLKEIVPEERVVDELLGILDQFDTEYVRNPEPKVQLIGTLEDYPSDDVRLAVEPFLKDISEPVRFTAVTTVFAMNSPDSLPSLLEALAEEESLRVRNRISRGLAERAYSIPSDLEESCRAALPEGFRLQQGRVVRSA